MLIKQIKLFSPNLDEQLHFYTEVLDLKLKEKKDDSFTVLLGDSFLTFVYRKETDPYHFAINIPANKEEEALAWLKEKVTILKDGEREIQDFDFWNAKAMYFYDVDKNIVEFIARKNLDNSATDPFTSAQLLEISEMGMPSDSVAREYEILQRETGIPTFSGDLHRFCAIGDDHGLFICINKAIKGWFPTGEKAYAADFEISFVEKHKRFNFSYVGGILKRMR